MLLLRAARSGLFKSMKVPTALGFEVAGLSSGEALYNALKRGHLPAVRILVEGGALAVREDRARPLLKDTIWPNWNLEIMEYLLRKSQAKQLPLEVLEALEPAAADEDSTFLRLLLEHDRSSYIDVDSYVDLRRMAWKIHGNFELSMKFVLLEPESFEKLLKHLVGNAEWEYIRMVIPVCSKAIIAAAFGALGWDFPANPNDVDHNAVVVGLLDTGADVHAPGGIALASAFMVVAANPTPDGIACLPLVQSFCLV
ncbi:hypothetical protein HK097_001355 [Rhizophlyctis rosea]|uniref:Uncharacterized protein n=1 Tax=Rhizophlyctis rosea TaxID=64517 RepID=A0AAD5WYZ0_9FUNG|nr:hypothetical protein HK097_001355 [Rhizophlyctis rosea]